ncbi:MAG: glycoside hydrolase family 2 TIM barrel-domain containing protein [Rikenellaceae bacterium]
MKQQHLIRSLSTLLSIFIINGADAQMLFNDNWRFTKAENIAEGINEALLSTNTFDDSSWESVSLPHTANMEPIIVNDQWQGVCWYRKDFTIEDYSSSKKYILEFEAAMNQTTIWINENQVKSTQGGYLPIVIDITPFVSEGKNTIALRLDNNDNQITGPKPLAILDFNMYGGLYRNAWLTTKNKTHITDPILANRAASGGLFITFPSVSESSSQVKVQTHVANEENQAKELSLTYKIFSGDQVIKSERSKSVKVAPYASVEFTDIFTLADAALWSPQNPNLHRLEVELWCEEEKLDREECRFGIREITFVDNQIYINGEKTYLRGVNRHQEYPYIGYALSDNAQYRDAKKIKDAGFDYIRLSHYPQSPAFMDACDELGLMVADAILGWQFYRESDDFKSHSYQSARDLIRRDRNHPCVLAWEVSLNETQMPVSFMQVLHNIVHEEYPGENVYTCGWMPDVYDIYFQARQHRIGHPDQMTFEKPYMVSEYGDWEYYSTNAGLNQHKHSREKRLELSSRQLRGQGEGRLLQQAYNLQESHNDNMNIPATGDSYWVMYDYNRGYHDEIESSGIMDIFRLPKFSYYFYQSQRSGDPVVEIATYWNEESPTDVRVFSNCDKVSLYLNGRLIATQSPDQNEISGNLNHPPFTFAVGEFKAGELKAVGYMNDKAVKESAVRTPKKVAKLKCWIDESGRQAQAGCNDVLFLYVAAVDKNGTLCPDFTDSISITVDDKVTILNTDGVITEAGIATALIKIGDQSGTAKISATSSGKLSGEFEFEIK